MCSCCHSAAEPPRSGRISAEVGGGLFLFPFIEDSEIQAPVFDYLNYYAVSNLEPSVK